jgi:hypothetical protein
MNPKTKHARELVEFNKRKRSCAVLECKRTLANCVVAGVINASGPLYNTAHRLNRALSDGTLQAKRRELRSKALELTGRRPVRVKDWQEGLRPWYKLAVFDADRGFKLTFSGASTASKSIVMLKRRVGARAEYDLLLRPGGYFSRRFFCRDCFGFSESAKIHCCRNKCSACKGNLGHKSKMTARGKIRD